MQQQRRTMPTEASLQRIASSLALWSLSDAGGQSNTHPCQRPSRNCDSFQSTFSHSFCTGYSSSAQVLSSGTNTGARSHIQQVEEISEVPLPLQSSSPSHSTCSFPVNASPSSGPCTSHKYKTNDCRTSFLQKLAEAEDRDEMQRCGQHELGKTKGWSPTSERTTRHAPLPQDIIFEKVRAPHDPRGWSRRPRSNQSAGGEAGAGRSKHRRRQRRKGRRS